MSEDNVNKNNDNTDDAVTQKDKEIEQLKNEKAAMEMKLRKSDDDLYSEDYLAFKNEQSKKQQPQNTFMSGGKLSDYSEDEIKELPLTKLVGLIRNDVYSQIKGENQNEMSKKEMAKQKENIANARVEIKKFAKEHSDFRDYVGKIDELSQRNPNLNIEQLYLLAGGKLEKEPPPKKEEAKPKPTPNTRPGNEAGMKQSDKDLSLREVIAQEYQKIK